MSSLLEWVFAPQTPLILFCSEVTKGSSSGATLSFALRSKGEGGQPRYPPRLPHTLRADSKHCNLQHFCSFRIKKPHPTTRPTTPTPPTTLTTPETLPAPTTPTTPTPTTPTTPTPPAPPTPPTPQPTTNPNHIAEAFQSLLPDSPSYFWKENGRVAFTRLHFMFFPCPLPFIFSSVPFLLTYLSCSPSQVLHVHL